MLIPGQAFWRGGHPWIIITDPIPQSGAVVCVNLTTLDEDCVDDQCILTPADYGWIQHATAVAFSYARAWDVLKLDGVIAAGLLPPANPPQIPPKTLHTIRRVAYTVLDEDLRKLL